LAAFPKFSHSCGEVVECNIFLSIDARDFRRIGQFEGFAVFADGIATGERRVNCFDVRIADDDVDEDVESFTVILELDEGQGGVSVNPNVTTIFIIDNDGKCTAKRIYRQNNNF
jgi:hypothetical protein